MSAVRLACPGVKPLQVWNIDIGGGQRFWQAVGGRVVEKLAEEHTPQECARIIANALIRGCLTIKRAHDFDTVFLAGGGAEMLGLNALLPAPPLWLFGGRDYAWTAKEWLFGQDPMVVVDVGQTSIKCFASPGARFFVDRDLEEVPFRTVPGKAARSIRFIGKAIRDATAMLQGAPLLLSLPMPLDVNCVPGESSYGVDGLATFVDEVLVAAEVSVDLPVYVINDAELAAECARAAVPPGRKVLVLTLGLGPGAALVDT